MDGEKGSFPEALRAYAEEARRKLGEHPAVEVLVAYHEGRLPEAEREQVADHLALCATCRELLLDLAGGGDPGPPEGTQPLSDRDVVAAWEGLRGRLRSEKVRPLPGAAAEARQAPAARLPSGHPPSVNRYFLALAASLLLAVAGFGWGWVNWRRLHAPQGNVQILEVDDRTRGDSEVQVPAGGDFILWMISPEPEPSGAGEPGDVPGHGEYVAEVRRGEEVLYRIPLANHDGSLTLGFRRGLLPAGSYQVVLFRAADGGPGEEVARYLLEVEG